MPQCSFIVGGRSSVRGRRVLVATAATLLIGAGLVGSASPALAATELRPDLRMAKLTDFSIERTSTGWKRLRFTTRIVNLGTGRFAVRGTRPSQSSSTMSTHQVIYRSDRSYRTVATPSVMFFAGDGHLHWHLRNLQSFGLYRLSGGPAVGFGVKRGFCFFDNVPFQLTLPGAPRSPWYTGCGVRTDLAVRMGLSVGWGDRYGSTLPGQYIPITHLPDGLYRLRVTADIQNWFVESNDSNNSAWTTLRIQGTTVTVVSQSGGV